MALPTPPFAEHKADAVTSPVSGGGLCCCCCCCQELGASCCCGRRPVWSSEEGRAAENPGCCPSHVADTSCSGRWLTLHDAAARSSHWLWLGFEEPEGRGAAFGIAPPLGSPLKGCGPPAGSYSGGL